MTQNHKHNNKKQAYLNCLRMTALILGIIFVELLTCYAFGVFKVPNTPTTPKSSAIQNSISNSDTTESSTGSAFTNKYNDNTNNSNHTTSATVTDKTSVKVSEVKSNTNKTSTNHQATIIASDDTTNRNATNQKNATNNTTSHLQKQNDSTSTGVIYYQYPRLYAQPNPHSTILISNLECGIKVTILGYSDEYYHVNVDGQIGYIYYKFIDIN